MFGIFSNNLTANASNGFESKMYKVVYKQSASLTWITKTATYIATITVPAQYSGALVAARFPSGPGVIKANWTSPTTVVITTLTYPGYAPSSFVAEFVLLMPITGTSSGFGMALFNSLGEETYNTIDPIFYIDFSLKTSTAGTYAMPKAPLGFTRYLLQVNGITCASLKTVTSIFVNRYIGTGTSMRFPSSGTMEIVAGYTNF